MNVFMALEHFPKLFSEVLNLSFITVATSDEYVSVHEGEGRICRVVWNKMAEQMVSFSNWQTQVHEHGIKVSDW